MRRILFFISVLFSVLVSCSDDIQKYDADVYENAVKYLSQNMNKYLKNNLISQKWENDNLHFRLKSDTIFKSYKINLTNLELTEEEYPFNNTRRVSYLEFVSPDKERVFT